MRRTLSIVECFDAMAAKAYLKRSRTELIAWLVSFALFTATAIILFALYGADVTADRAVVLWLSISFFIVDLGGLAGSVTSAIRYLSAQRTVVDSGEYIREVAVRRSEVAIEHLSHGVAPTVFEAQGFYFGDIDTPYQMRVIGDNRYSSNYQSSVLYVDGNHLNYKTVLFSLIGQEERILNGSIPFDLIGSVSIIKANQIDLFCPQLKVVFGSQCMLFALDERCDYREALDRLRSCVEG